MKKMPLHQLISINFYWLGLSFMWNSLHPIVLPAVLLHLVPDALKNTYLGILSFVGLILAMVVQPISGAISDGWRSRWGRRRPLALLGTLLDFIFLALLAWSGNLLVVVIGYVGLQIVSNIAHGPMQGLIPDLVPLNQMGIASGLKNLMDIGGVIFASLAAGRLLSPDDRYPASIMLVVMVVLALSAAVTFLTAREQPCSQISRNHISIKSVFRVDINANADFYRLLSARFIFLFGLYGVQAFAQYFIRDVLQAPNPLKTTADLMAVLALTLLIGAVLGGWLTDRFGARLMLALASALCALGCFLLVGVSDLTALTFYAGLLGTGIGLYLTANWALANRLAPSDAAGKFLGLTNLATAGASALSKLTGIPVDTVNNAFPGRFLGYKGLFLSAGVCALLSLVWLSRVKDHHSAPG